MNNRNLIQNTYLFRNLSPQELDAVAGAALTQDFGRGDTIFLRGEAAKALYLIKSGSVKIQQSNAAGDGMDVATLTAGSHFGEMAFVDSEPRSATAVSAEISELVVIPYEKLNAVLGQNAEIAVKFYRELAHFLAGRLRVTTNDLSFARERNLTHF